MGTSEFLYGKIAVQVIYPESAGAEDLENWTTLDPAAPPPYDTMDRRDAVVAEIAQGLDRLATDYPDAQLTWVIETYENAPVSVEPIAHRWEDQGSWMQEAFAFHGYRDFSYFGSARTMITLMQMDAAAPTGDGPILRN